MKDCNSIFRWQNRKVSNSLNKSKRKDKIVSKNLRYGLLLEIPIMTSNYIDLSILLDKLYRYSFDDTFEVNDKSCYKYDAIHWKVLENSDMGYYYTDSRSVFFVLKSSKLGIFIESSSYVKEFDPYVTGEIKEFIFTSSRMRKFILPIKRARTLYIEKDKGMELDEGNFKLRYKILDYLVRSRSYSAGISERMADL
jgi:hypothetical protein